MAKTHLEVVVKGHIVATSGTRRPINNVYFYESYSDVVTYSPANVFTALQAQLSAAVYGILSSEYHGDETTIRRIDDSTEKATIHASMGDGGIGGDACPADVCVLIQLKGNGRGRKYLGKKFLSPIAKSHTDFDEIAAGSVGTWEAARDAIAGSVVDSDGNTWVPVVLQKQESTLENPTDIHCTILDPLRPTELDLTLKTLRRRSEKPTVVS